MWYTSHMNHLDNYPSYLESLNDAQKKAVLATEGPCLIVAGAGAGKTKTLTCRILHLIANGVQGESILAITFTNKAAKEMRERVHTLLTDMNILNGIPLVSTFHSLGVRIIKENATLLSLPRHFTIFDKADSKKALKDAFVYFGIDPKEHIDTIHHIISREKGKGIRVEEYMENGTYDYTSEITKKVWTRYEEILQRDHALDFDDLLCKALHLLTKYPEIKKNYQNRFKYIHVDEYQDTNAVQNKIIDLLAAEHQNICAVGDTDQNIYSWRGAEIKNMLHFEKTYPNVQTFFLEQNYRSTQTILGAANAVIEKNKFRIPKKLFTENSQGEKIGIFEARDESDEAQFIAVTCKSLIAEVVHSGIRAEDIAVLFRANFQSRALEEAFLAYGVSYQLLGTKFFERKEVKDIMSYVRASLNTPERNGQSEVTNDLSRIINMPPRGIGKVTIEKIMNGREEELSSAILQKINAVRTMLRHFGEILKKEKPSEALRYIITHSGLEAYYEKEGEEGFERLQNIRELVTLGRRYDSLFDEVGAEEAIETFLVDASLQSDQDELQDATKENTTQGVKLLTVHAGKGLEFEYVFVVGMEDGLFPMQRRNNGKSNEKKSGEDAEEERRLFYVALTRAKKKLFLTWAQTRTIFGMTEMHNPSTFMADIPKEYTIKETWGEKTEKQTKLYDRKPLFKIDF